MKRTDSGFTLVEIMIVVLIIALLSSIAIPNILRARVNAHDASAQAALKAIGTAMEAYLSSNNIYPADTTSLVSATPPYLQVDYFSGTHNGFTFTLNSLSNSLYSVTAEPVNTSLGSSSFSISTGSVLVTN